MDAITINEKGEGEMFSGQDLVPWHTHGTVVSGLATSAEAIRYAHMAWKVKKEKMQLMCNGVKVEGYDAIVREDNLKVLGVAQGRYELIQNEDSFDFFDSVIGENQAVYDTAGTLQDGRVIWVMAKLPGHLFIDTNPEDKIEKNVLLVNSHNLTFSLMMQVTPVRVVCWNTLTAALRTCSNRIKIRHTKSFRTKIEEAQKALNLATAYFDDLQGLINILAKTAMTSKEMTEFTKRLLPAEDEDDPSTRITNIRENIEDLFANGKGNLGRSRWDALNAVTEYVDYHRSTRGESTRFESGLLGSGANLKQRAVNLLTP